MSTTERLAQALREVLATLKRENERAEGPIKDTIWHGPAETLFDFIENTLGAHEAEKQAGPVAVTRDQIREVFLAEGFAIKEGQTDLKDYVYRAAEKLLALAEKQAGPVAAQGVAPEVRIRCETESGGLKGSTYLNVIRVEVEDDGSLTAVTDHWSTQAPAVAHAAPPSESDKEDAELPEHETPAMHDAVMAALYEGVTRNSTDRLWQAYRGALLAARAKKGA